jgi:hypothetical protein
MGSNPGIRTKTGWIRVRIMCPRETTCLSVGCCFNELAIQKSNSACFLNTKQTPILLLKTTEVLQFLGGTMTGEYELVYFLFSTSNLK